MEASHGQGGILLQNANTEDMGGTLHLRGSIPVLSSENDNHDNDKDDSGTGTFHGILYNPAIFYNRHQSIESSAERQQILKQSHPSNGIPLSFVQLSTLNPSSTAMDFMNGLCNIILPMLHLLHLQNTNPLFLSGYQGR